MKTIFWMLAGSSVALWAQCTSGNLNISNTTLASSTYEATGSITADAGGGSTTTLISSGSSVVFQAGTSITLLPNFHAANGSSFTASIAGCTPPTLTSVGVSPGTVTSGSAGTVTVTLSAPAPYGGANVALSASPSSPFPVPSNLMVLAGQTSASTNVMAGSVTSLTSVTVSGTYGGTHNTSVTVDPSGNPTTPLQLPSTRKGVTYFPRGHAWWNMLYDWYTQDCTTSTVPQSCVSGEYVYQVVQNDLTTLHQKQLNYIHLYIWDQDIVQDVLSGAGPGGGPLLTQVVSAPGFVGDDLGGPTNSPNNQYAALQAFVQMAAANQIWVCLELAPSRPGKRANKIGYSQAGTEYGNWMGQFMQGLKSYQDVVIYGLGWSIPGPVGALNTNSWADFWNAAYANSTTGILATANSNAYPASATICSSVGTSCRPLLMAWTGFWAGYPDPNTGAWDEWGDVPDILSGYKWGWQGLQSGKSNWKAIDPSGLGPDLYAIWGYNASTGDLQAAFTCLAGTAVTSVCDNPPPSCASSQSCIGPGQIIVTELSTGSSFENSPIGNVTAGWGDSSTPTTTAAGQAQWLTNTLCALKNVGITKFSWHGLYDSASWWEQYFNYSGFNLAWNGYWGLSSETASYGNKQAWSAMLSWPGNCPSTTGTSAAPPVLALQSDATYYTINDTGIVTWGAADVTSLSLPNESPQGTSPSYSCKSGAPLPPSSLTGSCAYAGVAMTNTATQLTITGSNTDVGGQAGNPNSSTGSTSINVTVGLAPLVTGIVDYNNTSQQCNLQTNPGCTIAVNQGDILEIYGEGFDLWGGNSVNLNGGAVALSGTDGSYFWDSSRTLINAQLTSQVTPGSWTFTVTNPNSPTQPSLIYSICVRSSSGCP